MPAYLYPITIKRNHQTICYEETKTIENDRLTLKDLAFVGEDKFMVEELSRQEGYCITAFRSRKETDSERDFRVAGEEAYMAEYTRRKELRHPKN
jgi:hypothetical protein